MRMQEREYAIHRAGAWRSRSNAHVESVARRDRANRSLCADGTDITQANKFTVEGEKRDRLHIARGRDSAPSGRDVLARSLKKFRSSFARG